MENRECEVRLSKAVIIKNKIVLCKSCDSLFNKTLERNADISEEAMAELNRRANRTEMILKKKGMSAEEIYNTRILKELKNLNN